MLLTDIGVWLADLAQPPAQPTAWTDVVAAIASAGAAVAATVTAFILFFQLRALRRQVDISITEGRRGELQILSSEIDRIDTTSSSVTENTKGLIFSGLTGPKAKMPDNPSSDDWSVYVRECDQIMEALGKIGWSTAYYQTSHVSEDVNRCRQQYQKTIHNFLINLAQSKIHEALFGKGIREVLAYPDNGLVLAHKEFREASLHLRNALRSAQAELSTKISAALR